MYTWEELSDKVTKCISHTENSLSFKGTFKYGKASILFHINIFYPQNMIYWYSKQVTSDGNLEKSALERWPKTQPLLPVK